MNKIRKALSIVNNRYLYIIMIAAVLGYSFEYITAAGYIHFRPNAGIPLLFKHILFYSLYVFCCIRFLSQTVNEKNGQSVPLKTMFLHYLSHFAKVILCIRIPLVLAAAAPAYFKTGKPVFAFRDFGALYFLTNGATLLFLLTGFALISVHQTSFKSFRLTLLAAKTRVLYQALALVVIYFGFTYIVYRSFSGLGFFAPERFFLNGVQAVISKMLIPVFVLIISKQVQKYSAGKEGYNESE